MLLPNLAKLDQPEVFEKLLSTFMRKERSFYLNHKLFSKIEPYLKQTEKFIAVSLVPSLIKFNKNW